MIILLPIFLLLFAALSIAIIYRIRPGLGFTWLIAIGASLASWILIFYIHWSPVPPLSIAGWNPLDPSTTSIIFQIDLISWPYAFGLSGLTLAVLLTAVVRLEIRDNPFIWIGTLAISSAALFAVLAGNPLTLALAWVAFDCVELILILSHSQEERSSQQVIISYAAKVTGTLILLLSIIYSRSIGKPLSFNELSPQVSIFLLIAAGLRLGVVARSQLFWKDTRMRRGLGTILRLSGLATNFVLLSRLPGLVLSQQLLSSITYLVILISAYGACMWLAASDEINGRPYWMIAMAGICMACILQGDSAATLAWGTAAILSGGVLFLFSKRNRMLLTLPLLAFLGLSGLPFTLSASGWAGIVTSPFHSTSIIFWIILLLIFAGFIKHSLKPNSETVELERWMQVVYPLGLVFLIATQWLIGVLGWPGSFTPGLWWASVITAILIIPVMFGLRKLEFQFLRPENNQAWWVVLSKNAGSNLTNFFNFRWVFSIVAFFYKMIEWIIDVFSKILEGDGGVLWVILLLIIFGTLIIPLGM
jgi:hypothetical protein